MSLSGEDMAKALQDSRSLLLGCEAIGWLHMAGKAHPDFLRGHGGVGISCSEKQWHEALDPGWSDRLDWLRMDQTVSWPQALTAFLQQYDEGRSAENVVGCLQAGHAMASGIEKNVPGSTSDYLKQDATHMWLTTAFGHPVSNLLVDPPDVLHDHGWNRLVQQIGCLLDELKRLNSNRAIDVDTWRQWREGAIGPDGWLRCAFETTLAETRVPNNDVTLWDQSYIAAALFKSALAGLILLPNRPSDAWRKLKPETRWRVLTIGIGTEHYESRAVRIGDWIGAREEIHRFFEEVRRLVEVDLSAGSLVYRDEEAMAFTFPGFRFDDEANPQGRSLDDSSAEKLREWIESKVDALARNYVFETPPLCRLSRSTRSFISIARAIAETHKQLAVPIHRTWAIPRTEEEQGHVCPVCQVRFSGRSGRGEANPKQRPCAICYKRRKGRLDMWVAHGKDTIWITELADDNDRVALLTLSLDIDPWIDGSHADSLRAQSVAEWRRFNPTLRNQDNPIDPAQVSKSLEEYITSFVRNPTKVTSGKRAGKLDDAVFASLQDGFEHEEDLATYYHKIVDDRAHDSPEWAGLTAMPDQAARWLIHQLFRKNASPGRIHRFWRTAEAFFNDLMPAFREAAARHDNRWRTRRLVIKPANGTTGGWEDRATYTMQWNDAPLELLYRKESGDFLTVCNLARVFHPHEQANALEGLEREVQADDGQTRTLTIGDVAIPESLGVCTPLIILDANPRRSRVLLPLNAVPECIDAAVRKWEREFGRVWDRMPLRIGVVAFPRMTPFQAVIEATRNLEDDLSMGKARWETWRVVERQIREGIAAISLVRPDNGHELVTVPTTLPDGRPDVFYPYVTVTDRKARHPRDFVTPPCNGMEGSVYRHVADLYPGDGLKIVPSRFGTVFMDSTARRFETTDVRYLSDWRRIRETWQILCRVAPSITALRAAWTTLTDARQRWSGSNGAYSEHSATWGSLARSVLANDLGAREPELDALVDAAACGVLEDCIEWQLRVLKRDLEETK